MKTFAFEPAKRDGYEMFRIPCIASTGRGKLVAACEARRSASDWADIDLTVRTSCDGGETWSERVVLDAGRGETVNNPVLFTEGEQVMLLWQRAYSRTFSAKSCDGGKTWGSITEHTGAIRAIMPEYTVIAVGPGHGCVARDGRYLTPAWFVNNTEDPHAHFPSRVTTLVSADKGESWVRGEILDIPFYSPSECQITETDKGFLMTIRQAGEKHRRVFAESRDGLHWENIRQSEVNDPICCCGMIANRNTVFLTHCDDENNRLHLTLEKSEDFGKSWQKIMEIDPIGGYSDLACDGESLYVLHEENPGSYDLKCTRIDLNEFSRRTT